MMLRRTWSIRRPQTYSLTRRVDAGTAMQREKGMIRCQVTLLDDSVFTCDIDVSLLPVLNSLQVYMVYWVHKCKSTV